jgi:hypothetical protein
VVLRDSAKNINLIANHVLTALHQLLVNNLHGIVFTGINLAEKLEWPVRYTPFIHYRGSGYTMVEIN